MTEYGLLHALNAATMIEFDGVSGDNIEALADRGISEPASLPSYGDESDDHLMNDHGGRGPLQSLLADLEMLKKNHHPTSLRGADFIYVNSSSDQPLPLVGQRHVPTEQHSSSVLVALDGAAGARRRQQLLNAIASALLGNIHRCRRWRAAAADGDPEDSSQETELMRCASLDVVSLWLSEAALLVATKDDIKDRGPPVGPDSDASSRNSVPPGSALRDKKSLWVLRQPRHVLMRHLLESTTKIMRENFDVVDEEMFAGDAVGRAKGKRRTVLKFMNTVDANEWIWGAAASSCEGSREVDSTIGHAGPLLDTAPMPFIAFMAAFERLGAESEDRGRGQAAAGDGASLPDLLLSALVSEL
jgi:hypothetical protein